MLFRSVASTKLIWYSPSQATDLPPAPYVPLVTYTEPPGAPPIPPPTYIGTPVVIDSGSSKVVSG